jgi:hypothetical protein
MGMSMRVVATVAVLLPVSVAWVESAVAQERPQKGQSAGRVEMTRQVQGENSKSFETTATESLRHARKQPLMTPQQSTDAFLGLDRDGDMLLSRSELPKEMIVLRAQFDKYDLDRDHRLSYSEFASYTDVVPDELARSQP